MAKIVHLARLASLMYNEYTAFGYPHDLNDFISNLAFAKKGEQIYIWLKSSISHV